MIIKNEDALKRLQSPMNLINQLRDNTTKRKSAMSLFIPEKKIINPFESKKESLLPIPQQSSQAPTEKLDNILENHESQIKLGLAHDKALELLNRSVDMLSEKLDDVSAAKLPSVISAASKTVESIRKERLASKQSGADREVHYHFYTPQQRQVSDYEVIDVPA